MQFLEFILDVILISVEDESAAKCRTKTALDFFYWLLVASVVNRTIVSTYTNYVLCRSDSKSSQTFSLVFNRQTLTREDAYQTLMRVQALKRQHFNNIAADAELQRIISCLV